MVMTVMNLILGYKRREREKVNPSQRSQRMTGQDFRL